MLFLLTLYGVTAGCMSPTLMPAEPMERVRAIPQGAADPGAPGESRPVGSPRGLPHTNGAEHENSHGLPSDPHEIATYDTDGDGRGDYAEQQGPDGRVAVLHFDTNRDGELDLQVTLDQLDSSQSRELLIILDSVPYQLVRALRDEGRLRLFHEPSAIVAPFPVMTDLCLAEFFGVSPCLGIESRYYDGRRLSRGVVTYFLEGNAPWLKHVDAYILPINHAYIYTAPETGYLHELYTIERAFFGSEQSAVCGYSVGASALGTRLGEAGHRTLLEYVDRFCQSVMQRTRGRVRITLMSDHGHNLVDSKPISLHKSLATMGYRDAKTLSEPGDVVIPRYGPVTCAGIYTREPDKVAADVVKIEGVDLSFYRSGDGIAVRSTAGRAYITRSGERYRYLVAGGDPLQLLPIVERLREEGKLDAAEYAGDADWFAATADHVYPDPMYRLHRAFDGLMVHTPDVMVSLKDGYCYGTSMFNWFVKVNSAHGSLLRSSTHGFVMSTAGPLADPIRMKDLAAELHNLGLNPRKDH